ncbi:TorF family putative porin [soil metagenome]
MNKVSLSIAAVTVAAMGLGSASAADLGKVYKKAPPIEVVSPWDIAFGAAIMSDYVSRGITQSNHGPSATAYFEPRYNINPNLQLYVGTSWESISFPNRAQAEVDIYGGIRPTFGPVAFDFGVWGYLYPGGQCFNTQPFCGNDPGLGGLPINGSFAKKDASFYEVYGKVNYTFNDNFALGGNVFYSPNFLNTGADGTYASITGKVTAPSGWFGTTGIGSYISGEFGHQWLGTSDAFYGNGAVVAAYAAGIPYADYNTWNIGIGFTYKVFTLDLRYSDTDLSKGDCNAFTSDYGATAFGAQYVTPINGAPGGGFGSSWCGSAFIAKLSADVTLGALK